MLKPVNQPRSSPISPSPRLHHQNRYASSSPQTTTLPRRTSIVADPPLTPTPARPQQGGRYVSRGTQYSPMIQKMDESCPEPKVTKTERQLPSSDPSNSTPASTLPPPSPSKPSFQPESPGVKRRQPGEGSQSTKTDTPSLPLKRVRSAPTAVKALPAKYEACPVEDVVVLIANMISELIETNDALPPRPNPVLTRFHSR